MVILVFFAYLQKTYDAPQTTLKFNQAWQHDTHPTMASHCRISESLVSPTLAAALVRRYATAYFLPLALHALGASFRILFFTDLESLFVAAGPWQGGASQDNKRENNTSTKQYAIINAATSNRQAQGQHTQLRMMTSSSCQSCSVHDRTLAPSNTP